jgi:hypothetical protein
MIRATVMIAALLFAVPAPRHSLLAVRRASTSTAMGCGVLGRSKAGDASGSFLLI